jgi:hypothetical protein
MTTQSTTPLLRRLIAGFLFSTLPPRERFFVALMLRRRRRRFS